MTEKRLILRILRIFYQGYRLIASGLKKEIAELEQELDEAAKPPADQPAQQP